MRVCATEEPYVVMSVLYAIFNKYIKTYWFVSLYGTSQLETYKFVTL